MAQNLSEMQKSLSSKTAPAKSTGLFDKARDAVNKYAYKAVDGALRPKDPVKRNQYYSQRLKDLKSGADKIDSGNSIVKDSTPLKQRISEIESWGVK